jgi:arabinose-5-phosphate isomerase
MVTKDDVILSISNSGHTQEINRLLPIIKKMGAKIISFTGDLDSPMAQISDVVIDVRLQREACPFNLAPTSSTTAMLVLGDALAMCVLEARGFKKADFAKRHPAGSIGRTMLTQIKDIMRTGDRNAVIADYRTVKDALMAMTKAKSGTISVVNRQGKLAGVFTDGDFRRHIARDIAVLNARIGSLMTRKPITIRAGALAVEALKIFEQRQIDDLIVVDEHNRPAGIVDSQDLPKFKIM